MHAHCQCWHRQDSLTQYQCSLVSKYPVNEPAFHCMLNCYWPSLFLTYFWIITYIAAWTAAYPVFDLHFLSDSDPAYDSLLHSLLVVDLGLLCNFITISDSGLCHTLDAYLGPLYYEYSFCMLVSLVGR